MKKNNPHINTNDTHTDKINRPPIESEKPFRDTLDNMLEGVQIIGFDWRYIYVNNSFTKHSKYSKEELLGYTVMEKFPGIEEAPIFKIYQQCFQQRVSIQLQNEFLFPDGSVGWFELSFQPVPEGISILSVDITERKKLEEQQALFASIINSSDDAIISKNLNGIITTWNNAAEKIFGYSSAEIIGSHISVIIPPYLLKEETTIINKIKKGESVSHYETERVKKDGTIINVSLTVSPVKDASGNIIGASKISRDITERIKAEQALLHSESRFKRIFESGIMGILFWDEKGGIYEANDRFLQITGYSRSDFKSGKLHWKEMTPPEYAELDEKALKEIELTGSCTPFEKEYIKKDGCRVPVLIGAASLNKNQPGNGVAFVSDMTQQKKAETDILNLNLEISKSEKRFRGLIENSYDIVSITDNTFNPIYRSPASERITGWTNEERKISKPIEQIHPDDVDELKFTMQKVLNSPETPFHVAFRIQHKDGHYIFMDGMMTNMLQNEAINGIVANFRDVTETKKAAEKIKESERIYRTIASNIPGSVILLLDKDYRYFLIEGDLLEKLGYQKKQLLGATLKEALSPIRYAEVLPDFIRVFSGETFSRESDRGEYHIITRFVPLKDERNEVYAAMVVVIDVTELKKAEHRILELNLDLEQKVIERTAQFDAVNKELEAFSYSVSHDLRAPLRAIIGFTAMLEDKYAAHLDEEAKRITGVIKRNTLKMGLLIDDLLAFSRMAKKEILKTHINTGAMVNEVIAEVLQQKEHKHISWNIAHLPLITADITTIRQVWINLISNAVKYSGNKEHPCIEIGYYPQDKQNVFFIKDNGAGFNEDYKHKLFKVFQRLHDPEEFEGTGIGLAIVQKIISRHGGKVWAEAKENEGACFYFSLPL